MAGGNDNITAIFVAGSEFLGNASPAAAEARARNAITKARESEAAEPASSGAAALYLRWPSPDHASGFPGLRVCTGSGAGAGAALAETVKRAARQCVRYHLCSEPGSLAPTR